MVEVSATLRRMSGPALVVGGILWVAIYVDMILIGLITGRAVGLESTPGEPALTQVFFSPRARLWVVAGRGSSRPGGAGAGAVAWLAIAGAVLAGIGLITAVVTLILPPVQDPSAVAGSAAGIAGATNALSGLATLLAALQLGVASLRSQVIPVSIAWILIATGVVTAPILFATPPPATTKWTTDTLACLVTGVAFAVVGISVIRSVRECLVAA